MRHIALRLGIILSCFLSAPSFAAVVSFTNYNDVDLITSTGNGWGYAHDYDRVYNYDLGILTAESEHAGQPNASASSFGMSSVTTPSANLFYVSQSANLSALSNSSNEFASAAASFNSSFHIYIDTPTEFRLDISAFSAGFGGTTQVSLQGSGMTVDWRDRNGQAQLQGMLSVPGRWVFHVLSNYNTGVVGAALVSGSPTLTANLTLTPVPIPSAVWLFGSALGLMGVMRRKLSS